MKNQNYTHSIMFHHFHDPIHPEGQGSISGADFEDMIDWLSKEHRILGADEYLEKLEKETLKDGEICLSFDDALLCQADIAVPILRNRKIKAFFFVYSSPFSGNPDPLEIYRYFRTIEFSDIDRFYEEFFLQSKNLHPDLYKDAVKKYDESTYLCAYPFYTKNDKWFRFLRDQVLGKPKYDEIMNQLMLKHKFDKSQASKKLWMNNQHIQDLHHDGHIVGLHSYSHPTLMHKLTAAEQENEYRQNFDHLRSILKSNPVAMSHPCGNYNDDTLTVLKNLGIKIGFRSNNSITHINSNLEVPRNDHANVFKEMKK